MAILVAVEIRSNYHLCNRHQGKGLVALINSNCGAQIVFQVLNGLQNDIKHSYWLHVFFNSRQVKIWTKNGV